MKMSWKIKGKGKPIKEVWEDFYGNLWFIAEKDKDYCFGYVRLYHCPEFAEWGSFPTLNRIKEQIGKNMIWKVKKENWGNIETYEKGLLVEI